MWIGIQEHEKNVENEYCAGTANVYKSVISASSDYVQHEDKVEHKRNLDTSRPGTFSSSELCFCSCLLLQIAYLLAEPTGNSRLQVTALGDILTSYGSSWYLWQHSVKSSHVLISIEETKIYRVYRALLSNQKCLCTLWVPNPVNITVWFSFMLL